MCQAYFWRKRKVNCWNGVDNIWWNHDQSSGCEWYDSVVYEWCGVLEQGRNIFPNWANCINDRPD